MNYNPQLVSFVSTDNLKLPGLLYEAENQTKSVLLYLHGNGSSSVFYNAKYMNIMAETLNRRNISFFPFNNRGAHYIKTLKRETNGVVERLMYGTAYELIKDCIYDIDGALSYLLARGYTTFYLAGMSTGANKICVYNKYKPDNPIRKYILLSGGDDTGLYYDALGKELFYKALSESHNAIANGRGMEMVSREMVDYPFSYQSLYDTINPDGDYNIFPFNETMHNLGLSKKKLFSEFAAITKPMLVVYGEVDKYCYGNVPACVEILKKHTAGKQNSTYAIIPQADHGFTGKEQAQADLIAAWL